MNLKEYLIESKFTITVSGEQTKEAGQLIRSIPKLEVLKSGYREGSAKYQFVVKAGQDKEQIEKIFKNANISVTIEGAY